MQSPEPNKEGSKPVRGRSDEPKPMISMYPRNSIVALSLILTTASASAALADFTLLPAPDRGISSLSTIKITFPEAKFLGMYGSRLTGVTLTSKTDPDVVYEPCNISYSTFFSPNSETFSLRRKGETGPTVIDRPGEYVLHIPAECFDICGDWYKHLGYNTEINVTYTIGESGSGFDNYFDPATVSVNPMPGNVMEFKDITLRFPVTSSFPTIDIVDINLISLERKGDDGTRYVVADHKYDDEGAVSFSFRRSDSGYPHPEYIYEPGEYTVRIPAGVFRLTATDIVNDETVIDYTVTGTNAASEQFRQYTLTPAPGKLEQIESIVLEYPDLAEALSFPEGVNDITKWLTGRVSLKRLHEDADQCSNYEVCSAELLDHNRICMRFRNKVSMSPNAVPETISRMGDYQLTVLPNTFKLRDNTFAFNARIEAYYTVARDVSENTMERYTLSPADGEETGGIGTMTLIFPEATDGLDFPVDRSRITLTNTGDSSDVYEARNLAIQSNKATWGWNRPDFPYDERITIRKEGIYRLDIREDTFRDYAVSKNANRKITALIYVSPENEFLYSLTPEPGETYIELTEIKIQATGGATAMHPTGTAGAPATLRGTSGKEYVVDCDDNCIFSIPEEIGEGNFTLNIPSGYFAQTNTKGKEILNKAISATYKIASPALYTASLIPASGTSLSGVRSITLTPVGPAFRTFGINPDAGDAVLEGNGNSMVLTPNVSQYSIAFTLPDDEYTVPGTYRFHLPAGYITIVDGNGLATSIGETEAIYNITSPSLPEFNGGMFILNEGAFGSEYSSLNYVEGDLRKIHYRVFSEANQGTVPGVTAQYAVIHGDRLYILSKQASYTDQSALLTDADAHTLAIRHQIALPGTSGRGICPVGKDKVYIGTSDGILVYDAGNGMITGEIEGTHTDSGKYEDQTGDMVRMGKYVFATLQDGGIHVIDPETDRVATTLRLPDASGVFVTAEGRLFAALANSATPFVEIDPETLETRECGDEARPVADQWSSWRSLPLTSAIRGNIIYYLPDNDSDSIASYDFDSGVYNPAFIKLPQYDGAQMQTYGTALSTEPESGYIVITATGPSGKYNRNAIYFASPATGRIDEEMTVYPERAYWFPAMTFYYPGRGPVLTAGTSMTLAVDQEKPIDLNSMVYLSSGNPYLIIYSAESSDPSVCSVARTGNGEYLIRGEGEGTARLSFTADYRGKEASAEIEVSVSGDSGIVSTEPYAGYKDVFDISGRLVLSKASPEQIANLPKGFYIIPEEKRTIKIQ